ADIKEQEAAIRKLEKDLAGVETPLKPSLKKELDLSLKALLEIHEKALLELEQGEKNLEALGSWQIPPESSPVVLDRGLAVKAEMILREESQNFQGIFSSLQKAMEKLQGALSLFEAAKVKRVEKDDKVSYIIRAQDGKVAIIEKSMKNMSNIEKAIYNSKALATAKKLSTLLTFDHRDLNAIVKALGDTLLNDISFNLLDASGKAIAVITTNEEGSRIAYKIAHAQDGDIIIVAMDIINTDGEWAVVNENAAQKAVKILSGVKTFSDVTPEMLKEMLGDAFFSSITDGKLYISAFSKEGKPIAETVINDSNMLAKSIKLISDIWHAGGYGKAGLIAGSVALVVGAIVACAWVAVAIMAGAALSTLLWCSLVAVTSAAVYFELASIAAIDTWQHYGNLTFGAINKYLDAHSWLKTTMGLCIDAFIIATTWHFGGFLIGIGRLAATRWAANFAMRTGLLYKYWAGSLTRIIVTKIAQGQGMKTIITGIAAPFKWLARKLGATGMEAGIQLLRGFHPASMVGMFIRLTFALQASLHVVSAAVTSIFGSERFRKAALSEGGGWLTWSGIKKEMAGMIYGMSQGTSMDQIIGILTLKGLLMQQLIFVALFNFLGIVPWFCGRALGSVGAAIGVTTISGSIQAGMISLAFTFGARIGTFLTRIAGRIRGGIRVIFGRSGFWEEAIKEPILGNILLGWIQNPFLREVFVEFFDRTPGVNLSNTRKNIIRGVNEIWEVKSTLINQLLASHGIKADFAMAGGGEIRGWYCSRGPEAMSELVKEKQLLKETINSISTLEKDRGKNRDDIARMLSQITREKRPFFNASQIKILLSVQTLSDRLEILYDLFEEKIEKNDREIFQFGGFHISQIIRSSKSIKEIRDFITYLKTE
ncbi:MAG: hypothetical protein KAU58_00190, partial [Candidatus Omnitrophica bacterium]|nr:hypothetical protein [Candidatus Omnitrophota bacterium]